MPMRKMYCYPFSWASNEYIKSQVRIWNSMGYEVLPSASGVCGALKYLVASRKDLLVLNWFEDRINYSKYPFLEIFRSLVMLLLFRLSFKKIIWVRHNIQGHDSARTFLRSAIGCFLEKISSVQLAHRPYKNCNYLPHPLYAIDVSGHSVRDIPFLYFGVIKPYKGLVELLQRWPTHLPLIIAGRCNLKELTEKIQKIIDERSLIVEWKNYFLSENELNGLLMRTQCLVVPHKEDTMIVSGAPFYAMEAGANILVRNGAFGAFLQERFDGVELFDLESLEATLHRFKLAPADVVMGKIKAECSDERLARDWQYFFNL